MQLYTFFISEIYFHAFIFLSLSDYMVSNMDIVHVFLAVLLVDVYCVASFGIFKSESHEDSTFNLGNSQRMAIFISQRIKILLLCSLSFTIIILLRTRSHQKGNNA